MKDFLIWRPHDTYNRFQKNLIDTKIFNHPLANQVQRKPISIGKGGSFYRSHVLTPGKDGLLYRKTTWIFHVWYIILGIIFSSFALILAHMYMMKLQEIHFAYLPEESIVFFVLFPMFVGIVTLIVYGYRSARSYARVIDTIEKRIFMAKLAPEQSTSKQLRLKKHQRKRIIAEDMCAIQIIPNFVDRNVIPSKIRYTTYQLNLVMKDEDKMAIYPPDRVRHRLMDHANLRAIRKEANIIAEAMAIPVRDALLLTK